MPKVSQLTPAMLTLLTGRFLVRILSAEPNLSTTSFLRLLVNDRQASTPQNGQYLRNEDTLGGRLGLGYSPQFLPDAGSGQLSQTLLRGSSFWLTAIKQSASLHAAEPLRRGPHVWLTATRSSVPLLQRERPSPFCASVPSIRLPTHQWRLILISAWGCGK